VGKDSRKDFPDSEREPKGLFVVNDFIIPVAAEVRRVLWQGLWDELAELILVDHDESCLVEGREQFLELSPGSTFTLYH